MFFVVWCYPANCHDSEYSAVTGSQYGGRGDRSVRRLGCWNVVELWRNVNLRPADVPLHPVLSRRVLDVFHSGVLTRWPPGGGSAQCYPPPPPFLLGASPSEIAGASPGTGPEPQWFPDMKSWKSGPARSVFPSDIPPVLFLCEKESKNDLGWLSFRGDGLHAKGNS
jgi:hypothetical protein